MLASAPRYLFVALYAAGVLVLVDQAAELLANLIPNLNLSDPRFRFSAFAAIIGRTTPAVLVDVLILLAAAALKHRRMLRIWGYLHLLAAALLLAGLALFLLDSVETRNAVTAGAQPIFLITAVRAGVMVLLAVGYCIAVVVATTRAARFTVPIDKDDDEGPLLVTGS